MSENKNHNLDLDSITAAINSNYDSQNASALPRDLLPPSASQNEQPVEVQKQKTIEAPFIILEFQHTPIEDQEGVFAITGFKATSEGIEASPEAIITHLNMVIDNIKQQVADGNVNDGPTED